MKKYTHAWLAFQAIKRLDTVQLAAANKPYADDLVRWYMNHRDGVIQGAWYPDAVIKDMATSHVLKFTPAGQAETPFRKLPSRHLMYKSGKQSPLYKKVYTVDKNTNLPYRCEAMSHTTIDNLKLQQKESKGSPVSPTDNHLAVKLFMLSHYIADAHMPFHCDSRSFSSGIDLHAHIEGEWDDEVRKYYDIDSANERFFYDTEGYPVRKVGNGYDTSILKKVEDELAQREFFITYGSGNSNVWDFMWSVCQYSYLQSYDLIPEGHDQNTVTLGNWQNLENARCTFEDFSVSAIADSIESIARIWLRVWRRYMKWAKGQD